VCSPRPQGTTKIRVVSAPEGRVLVRENSAGQQYLTRQSAHLRVAMNGDFIFDQNVQRPESTSKTLDGPPLPDMNNLETLSPDHDSPTTPTPPSPRVRFRSRVRITSGLHHHRHKRSRSYGITSDVPTPPCSSSSSRSGSPSSSISVPLRTHPEDGNSNSGWGPLGQRVSLLVSRHRANRDKEAAAREWRRSKQRFEPPYGPNERTPLASSPMRSSYVGGEGDQGCDAFDSEEDDRENARLSREIDLLFGKWPGRLLNYRWWWWQLEPVVGCHCVDDSEIYD